MENAGPAVVMNQPILINGNTTKTVNLIGYRPGSGLGGPGPSRPGHQVTGPGQAVVDIGLGLGVGQRFIVARTSPSASVWITSERSLFGGVANAYVTLHDVQRAVYGGHPVIGAVLVTGAPDQGARRLRPQDEPARSPQPPSTQMKAGVSSINSTRYFMWIIAAIIVAALVYVTALERTRTSPS